MGVGEEILFRLARRRVTARTAAAPGGNPATFDERAYMEWRARVLDAQLEEHFPAESFAGQDVLDFGCGAGALSFIVAARGAASVTGVDVAPGLVDLARAELARRTLPVRPQFTVTRSSSTGLADASIDVIVCFDTLEHVLEYAAVMREWRRVLRPGGRVLIWWCPWYHPYGHHIESLVPLPWIHAVFPERVLTRTCARIYDLPEFEPRIWDLDERGRKKPNKWRALRRLPDVNRLTIGRFERECDAAGFRIARRRVAGFGGSRAAKLTHVLTGVPGLREFFSAHVTYELRLEPGG